MTRMCTSQSPQLRTRRDFTTFARWTNTSPSSSPFHSISFCSSKLLLFRSLLLLSMTSPKELASVHSPEPGRVAPPEPRGQPGVRSGHKIIVVGESGVGKTCLTFRFCSGHFPGATEATIGVDFREKMLNIDSNAPIRLQLWDTAGQERFRRSMVKHYYRNVSAVVLVYDLTNNDSFKAIPHWIHECRQHGLTPDRVPMVLVGNKCDAGEVRVDRSEAQRFSDAHNLPLFETSAKDDSQADHVEAIFTTLALKIRERKVLIDANSGGRRILYQREGYKGHESEDINNQPSASFCCS